MMGRYWYFTLRQGVYAFGPVDLGKHVGAKAARGLIKERYRLLRGELLEVWPR